MKIKTKLKRPLKKKTKLKRPLKKKTKIEAVKLSHLIGVIGIKYIHPDQDRLIIVFNDSTRLIWFSHNQQGSFVCYQKGKRVNIRDDIFKELDHDDHHEIVKDLDQHTNNFNKSSTWFVEP